MENTSAKRYGRFLELEGKIPEMEEQARSLRESLREMRLDMELKEIAMKNLEDAGLFQRLLGRLDQKKEKAASDWREAKAAFEIASRKQEELEYALKQSKEELEALAGSRAEYEAEGCPKEVEAFLSAALEAAERCIDALNNMLPYARRDARTTYVRQGNRKMEFMAKAAENAQALKQILGLMPEGIVELGSYFQYPEHYITAVTSEYQQLDRVERAMNQVREVRAKLREMKE